MAELRLEGLPSVTGVPPSPAPSAPLAPVTAPLSAPDLPPTDHSPMTRRRRRHTIGRTTLAPGALTTVSARTAALSLDAAAERFALSRATCERIVEQLTARDVSFVARAGRRTLRIVPTAERGAPDTLGLAELFALEDPARKLTRLLPDLDPYDFGALLVAVTDGHSHNLVIDLDGDIGATFALGDGKDGNAAAHLDEQLCRPERLRAFAERMRRAGLSLRAVVEDRPVTANGVALREALESSDPDAALATLLPGVNVANLRRLLGDLSTLAGEPDPLAGQTLELTAADFRRAGLTGHKPYRRAAAQQAVRNALWNDGLVFTREVALAGRHVGVAAQPTDAQLGAARRGRLFAGSTGQGDVAWSDKSGPYTNYLIERLRESGKLGRALEAARDFGNPGTTQLATLTGNPAVLDTIPGQRMLALLIANSDFGDAADPLPGNRRDVRNMRRALTRAEGPAIPDERVWTVHDASAAQATAAIHALLHRASAGDAAIVYVSSHGTPDGILMADDQELANAEVKELYREAEARGVRLVLISDTCYAGAQVDAVRDSEIARLEAAGKAHPLLRPLDALATALAKINIEAEEVADARAKVSDRWRVFPAHELGELIADALRRGDTGSLRDALRAQPSSGAAFAALATRAAEIAARPEHERRRGEARILAYHAALVRLADAVRAAARALATARGQAALPTYRPAGALVDAIAALRDAPRVTQRDLARLIDQSDDLVRELIRRADRG